MAPNTVLENIIHISFLQGIVERRESGKDANNIFSCLDELVVGSMYYIKYKNKRNWKEISTAQDSGGYQITRVKFVTLDPSDVFYIPIQFPIYYSIYNI